MRNEKLRMLGSDYKYEHKIIITCLFWRYEIESTFKAYICVPFDINNQSSQILHHTTGVNDTYRKRTENPLKGKRHHADNRWMSRDTEWYLWGRKLPSA